MQYIAASIAVVSGTALSMAGEILEFNAYADSHGTTRSRSPGEFAEWGGLVVIAVGMIIIARPARPR